MACRSPISAVAPPAGGAPGPGPAAASPLDAPLAPEAERWVEATLAGLDLRAKAAQMVFVRAYGRYQHPDSAAHRRLLAEVSELGAGGIVLFASELESIPPLLNELQAAARVPLLVASDLERGLAFRVERGTVPLPFAMAIGATGSAAAARFAGEVTAREGRAVGIHWALAPVADVNSDPANPVIALRSFGEDPELVARLVAAFVEGARAGGMLTTAKHFPGHGDTATDSHRALPVLGADRERLAAVELVPFRRAVAAGVDSVMLGHIAVPAVDPSGAPATLSPALAECLLRGELGFTGLVATDALEMEGLRPAWTGEAAVEAVAAGADALLLPVEPRVAVEALVRAVGEGQLTEERLDRSVRRLLTAKARLGLDGERRVDPAALRRQVARPADVERAEEIAAQALTLVRDDDDLLPLRAEEPLRLLHLVLTGDPYPPQPRRLVDAALAARWIPVEAFELGPEISAATADRITAAARRSTHVLVSAFVRVASDDEEEDDEEAEREDRVGGRGAAGEAAIGIAAPGGQAEASSAGGSAATGTPQPFVATGRPGPGGSAGGAPEGTAGSVTAPDRPATSAEAERLAVEAGGDTAAREVTPGAPLASSSGPSLPRPALSPTQTALLRRLVADGSRVVLVSFGSPYLLAEVPEVPAYLCAYGWAPSSQRAAVPALLGEAPVGGRLPVTLPGLYPFGHGLDLDRRAMTLAPAPPAPAAPPAAAGFTPEGLAAVDRLLDGFVARGAFPGGVLAVGHRGKLAHLHPFGRLSWEPDSSPVAADTVYDLASLTKVVATTTMAMVLADEGRLHLDAPVASFLPGFTGPGKEAVTVRHLLTHSSGLPWWAPLHQELAGRRAYVERIQGMDLVYPPGSRSEYSDLGIVLLGEVLERVAGQPLDEFVRRRVLDPLGMDDTGFLPPAERLPRIAPTEDDPWRGRVLQGEVHDENAFAMGGVAPHAGLFGTAPDLARFAQMVLWGGVYDHRRIVSRETVERFTRRAGVPGSDRALGWDTRSAEGSSAGELFGPRSFGHTGFTGTSLWIDPDRELFVILLTNRVHPTRENRLIREARPAVADAVVRALVEDEVRVRVGLDRVAAGEVGALAGKRLGLVAHRASVTADGRGAVEVFREQGLELVRLFSPEHGLEGEAAAGEAVADSRDAASGLPGVSLYGGKTRPAAEDLAGLDALVFDLQDGGVRFYTYVSTLIELIEAAAGAGIELVVLDRPNPLGGERVEGPVAAPRHEVPESFLNRAPGPLVHGLTAGEMARHVNARLPRPARLTVVPMRGWERSMTWADTGRPWVPPSPNLRSPEAALAYPGTALLEATNVSEGRGTEAPFLLVGAPWLDPAAALEAVSASGNAEAEGAAARAAVGSEQEGAATRGEPPSDTPPDGRDSDRALAGFHLEPARFSPVGTPAAPHPKHEGTECRGFRVRVTDPVTAEPYRLGLALLAALSHQPGFAWNDGGAALTRLLGTPNPFAALGILAAGRPVDEIVAADASDHAAWRRERASALLY